MILKELIENRILARAKDMAWSFLSEKEQNECLKRAKREEEQHLSYLAITSVNETNHFMDCPNYISVRDLPGDDE